MLSDGRVAGRTDGTQAFDVWSFAWRCFCRGFRSAAVEVIGRCSHSEVWQERAVHSHTRSDWTRTGGYPENWLSSS